MLCLSSKQPKAIAHMAKLAKSGKKITIAVDIGEYQLLQAINTISGGNAINGFIVMLPNFSQIFPTLPPEPNP